MRPTLYPPINKITMVVPTKITDTGVYVKLIEYNNIEGLIILSDLSKSRIRSVNKIVPIGKKFPAFVLVSDTNTKNITLSKKAVTESEKNKCETNYKNLKYIYDLMNVFCQRLEKYLSETSVKSNLAIEPQNQVSLSVLYNKFIWCLGEDPELVLLALKTASKDFNKVYGNKLIDIDTAWVDIFQQILTTKFQVKDATLEAIMDICCFETGGINIIKQALLTAIELSNNEFPFKLKLIKSPYYSIILKTNDQEGGIKIINSVIDKIKNELEKNNAIFKIVKLPQIILEKEFEPEDSDSETDSSDN